MKGNPLGRGAGIFPAPENWAWVLREVKWSVLSTALAEARSVESRKDFEWYGCLRLVGGPCDGTRTG